MAKAVKKTASKEHDQLVRSEALVVCYGSDDFSVSTRGKEIWVQWCQKYGETDTEIINAAVTTVGEAEHALDQLELALQTLPFFGGCKLIWFKDCNFLAEDRTSISKTVLERLSSFLDILKTFRWNGVRLLITARKISAKRVFFKGLSQLSMMEEFVEISANDRGWEERMDIWLRDAVKKAGKQINSKAASLMVLFVGADFRRMESELEKLLLYLGDGDTISEEDVEAVVTRSKQSKSFALADAIGDRDLPRALRLLDADLAEMRTNSSVSEVGILYGIISKVRLLLLVRELLDCGYIKTNTGYGSSAKITIPDGVLPGDKKFNPALMNSWMVARCIPQAKRYTVKELVRGMDVLLQCNRALVFGGGDASLALQQTVIDIISFKRQTSL